MPARKAPPVHGISPAAGKISKSIHGELIRIQRLIALLILETAGRRRSFAFFPLPSALSSGFFA